jgi:lipopolysaccharide transport system permease protein
MSAPPAAGVLRIQPSHGWTSLGLRELWAYRELLYFLTWRDVKVRYKQTALGAAWAVIQPFFTMVVFRPVFWAARQDRVRRHPVPDLQLCGAGTVDLLRQRAWRIHQQPGRQREPDQEGLLPRLAIPLATVLSEAVDFAIAFVVCWP